MILQISLLALVAPLVCATIVLQAPNGIVQTDSPVTFTWTTSDNADPPYFSLVLQRTSFHSTYAIANNVLTTSGSINLTIPTVPVGDGYTLQAVNINDINEVYSNFGPFSIGAALSTSTTSTSSGATSSATYDVSIIATGSGTGSAVSPSNSATSAGTTTGTQTPNTGTSTPFNNGANQAASSFIALTLSALAGITFLAL